MSATRISRPFAALAAGAAALQAGCRDPAPVALGVVSSPTYVDAARLAVAHELAYGPIPGFDTVMIEEGDNRAAPAIEAAERVVAVQGIAAVVGHSNSAASLAAAPIYNSHEVVQIAPTASAVVYSEAGTFSFRLVPRDDRQGRFLAGHVEEILSGDGRVAVFYVNDDYGRGLREAVLSNLDLARYSVVVDLPHVEGDVSAGEVAHAAEALRVARPDLILWLARGSVLNRFLEGIGAGAPDVPVLGGDATWSGTGVPGYGRWGVVRFATYLDLNGTETLRAFGRQFRERYGREASAPDALTYDATRLLMSGIRSGARSGEELRSFLHSLGRTRPPYPGITGDIAFDDQGDIDRSFVLETLGGGVGH
jgi:branched-chain amino acid transport system substrate-binding protein